MQEENYKLTSTYEMTPKEYNEKDQIIANLKAAILEKEEKEDNFFVLQSEYRNLQNSYQILTEEKLNLEYELRKVDAESEKKINEQKFNQQKLLNQIDEKQVEYKKLYNENNRLFFLIQSGSSTNLDLNNKWSDLEERVKNIKLEKEAKENILKELRQNTIDYKERISTIKDEIDKLKKLEIENANKITVLQISNEKAVSEYESIKDVNQKIVGKITENTKSLTETQESLEKASDKLGELKDKISIVSEELSKNKDEYDKNKTDYQKEKRLNLNLARKNNQMGTLIKDLDNKVSYYNSENQGIEKGIKNLSIGKEKLEEEIEKYKNHILIVTEENDKLVKELQNIIKRDNQLKTYVEDRCFGMKKIVKENRETVRDIQEGLMI